MSEFDDLGHPVFDGDNHYYEALDAFTRHLDPALGSRCVQWCEINGRKYHVVGGRVSHAVVNPTFTPIAKPGAMYDYFRGTSDGRNPLEYLADREPIRDEYLQPRLAILVLRVDRLHLQERRRIDALGDLPAEEQLTAPWDDHGVERRVRDEPVDLVGHHDVGPLAVAQDLHAPAPHRRVLVAGEGVERLVVVVVRVEGLVGEFAHENEANRLRAGASLRHYWETGLLRNMSGGCSRMSNQAQTSAPVVVAMYSCDGGAGVEAA